MIHFYLLNATVHLFDYYYYLNVVPCFHLYLFNVSFPPRLYSVEEEVSPYFKDPIIELIKIKAIAFKM